MSSFAISCSCVSTCARLRSLPLALSFSRAFLRCVFVRVYILSILIKISFWINQQIITKFLHFPPPSARTSILWYRKASVISRRNPCRRENPYPVIAFYQGPRCMTAGNILSAANVPACSRFHLFFLSRYRMRTFRYHYIQASLSLALPSSL